MNENELSDALHDSLPPRPSVEGWADGARSKARKRRLAGASVGGLAVVALAVPLALQLGGSPSLVATPGPVEPASPAPVEPGPQEDLPWIPDACRAPDDGALPLVDDDLPPGATHVWLCGTGSYGGLELVGTVGAAEPLVTGVGEVVAEFNALEKQVGVLSCAVDSVSPDYVVVVEYLDGWRALRTGGCNDLRDTTSMFETFRADGKGFLADLTERWSAQRAEQGFAWHGTDVCTIRTSSIWGPVAPDRLTRAVACGATAQVELPEDLARRLIDSFAELGVPRAEEIGLDGPPTLVLLTDTGDPVSLVEWEGLGWNDGVSNHSWAIPADLRAELDGYLEQGGGVPAPIPEPTVELPSERGDGLEPKVCADVRSGALPPQELPGNENLPDGVARAWLCGDPWGAIGPLEPLTIDPDRIVEAVNALPASDADACTLMAGPTYHLVLDYPDGERRVVAMEMVNCQFVGGEDGRSGGAQLVEDLVAMWQEQREVAPAPFTDDVDLCATFRTDDGLGGPRSVMPVQRAEVVRGVLCGLPADATGFDEVVEIALPPEVLMSLSQDPVVERDPAGLYRAGLPALVLLNQFGDPMTALVGGDGEVWVEDWAVWLPPADLADLWRETLAQLG